MSCLPEPARSVAAQRRTSGYSIRLLVAHTITLSSVLHSATARKQDRRAAALNRDPDSRSPNSPETPAHCGEPPSGAQAPSARSWARCCPYSSSTGNRPDSTVLRRGESCRSDEPRSRSPSFKTPIASDNFPSSIHTIGSTPSKRCAGMGIGSQWRGGRRRRPSSIVGANELRPASGNSMQ
jgi:hypothetical protein